MGSVLGRPSMERTVPPSGQCGCGACQQHLKPLPQPPELFPDLTSKKLESKCVLQRSYTCCHTHRLLAYRRSSVKEKENQNENRTVWSNRELRSTNSARTHQAWP